MFNGRVLVCFITFLLIPCALVFANNLAVTNVKLGSRDPSAKTLTLFFDVSWDNSWRNKINHDAAWLTVRLSDGTSTGVSYLCKLSASGINPPGSLPGTNSNAAVYVPQDRIGAFIRPAAHQEVSTFISKNVKLTVDYSSAGFADGTTIVANIVAFEMVLVPEGAFYAGDFAFSTASLRRGSADSSPWFISGSSALTVTSTTTGGYYYVSAGHSGEFATGAGFVIPAVYPNGFAAFYAMKYEITESQWVAFINSLPANARTAHDLTDAAHKNSDSVVSRNAISCSGSPLLCATQRPARVLTGLGWKDITAFLDWAGLRPMSELEFEKSARGPNLPLAGEFAWGSTVIAPVLQLTPSLEDGTETVVDSQANAQYGQHSLTGGDAGNGPDSQKGALRSGIFSTSTSTRSASGAGNYGMMELSGNVKEWVVSVGSPKALNFTSLNGDGYLSAAPGSEGNANVDGWPGMDPVPAKGITSSEGAGLRGGSWSDPVENLRVSDRSEASADSVLDLLACGGRGARTLDGQ
jgi:formylglycine-generating enzyme required for sulfatase activity